MGSNTVEQKSNIRNGTKRLIFTLIAIVIQVAWIFSLYTWLNAKFEWIAVISSVVSVLLVLGIYCQQKTSSIKTPWIILILVFPLLGIFLYLLTGLSGSTHRMRTRFEQIDKQLFPKLHQDPAVMAALRAKDPRTANLAGYLTKFSQTPLFQNTDVVFYPEAPQGLEAQKAELRKAEKFIFMEYHAIEDAEAWAGIHEILVEKAKAGVEVRVFYDDMGSIGFINTDFVNRMEKDGIRCRVFNPMFPLLQVFLNNRDHRKITVVDGKVGFTGGYNLADEYFDLTHPFGQWKDTGVRLEGDAVKSLTAIFLEMWNASNENDKDDDNFDKYLIPYDYQAKEQGFVQPYCDSPLDGEHIGENVYMSLVEGASDYCWFSTPYLIITDEMEHAMGLAAKRGVDVRIITPGIPDKKLIYGVTRSYYGGLVKQGVRIFEFTPGFCHHKQCVADDRVAVCGTINLDYRSLYHHFENGCLMADCQAVLDMKADFENTFPKCREVTEDYRTGRNSILNLKDRILRLFAGLM